MFLPHVPDTRDRLDTPAGDTPAPEPPTLTAHLARSGPPRSSADPVTPYAAVTSADTALFEAVTTQTRVAQLAVAASRTLRWAATPTVEAASPHAETAPQVGGSGVTLSGWPVTVTVDPAAWLAGQLSRFSHGDQIDPYAELMLRRAGFAPAPR